MGLSPRPYAILIIKLKCHRSWYVTHLETIRFSDPVITYAHRRIRNTYILSIKRSIRISGAPFSFALSQGVTLRHLVHILTHVGDVAIILIGIG